MRVAPAILAAILIAAPVALPAQETMVLDEPFDPYVAVATSLPSDNFIESGNRRVSEVAMNLSTFRVRATGRIEHYLKVEITYPITPSLEALSTRINVSGAYFEAGTPADFEVIDVNQTCVDSPAYRSICKVTESLSVRFPFQTVEGGNIRVQFRDRGSTWRGTVSIPASVFAHNLKMLPARR